MVLVLELKEMRSEVAMKLLLQGTPSEVRGTWINKWNYKGNLGPDLDLLKVCTINRLSNRRICICQWVKFISSVNIIYCG